MNDDLHPNAEELQEKLRESLHEDPKIDFSDMVWLTVPDRPRGILSPTDREYLSGQTEYEHPQSESNRKQAIRERVVNAFQDFLLLTLMLSEQERHKIFHEEIPEKQESLASIISFLYLGLEEDVGALERKIEEGIYRGANLSKMGRWSGEVADVDAAINIERRPDRSEIIQKFEQGNTEELTPAEVGILVRSGYLDGEDLDELEDTSLPYPFAVLGGKEEQSHDN